ncbi:heme-binding protein [Ramlibacter sp.]|uniref:GlcG/HbpS family heme-binding protein n=1 Tax=Ramlibacter sp. TaxID=1917967 RepID=UPI0017A6A3C7|nr:heme-binding protein [Ramlibacter sp.]MBA2672894.1 heme-binding protein [Ramlibacter sp.]
MRALLALFVLPAMLGMATGTQAQQGATFEVRSLTPEAALKAASAALAKCRAAGYQVGVAVVDRAGSPLVTLRDRFAGPHTFQTALDKAYTAVTFKISTTELEAVSRPGGAMSGLRQLPRVVAIGGGLQISAAGSQVGGIGVSGAPGGEADEACAKAGIASIADDLEM